ncbi:MAG: Aurachin B dehydrogenase [Turneriella sp.]|nr:Aurachin B dehydrogenase [Turneriella sp.]
MPAQKVLITGATGFVGGHLIEACLKKKYKVRALVMPQDATVSKLNKKKVEIVYGDLRDFASLENAVRGVSIVFHAAAVVTDWAPQSLFDAVHITGTENICRASVRARVKRFVLVSTNDVFGLREDKILDESAPFEPWGEPYPDTKIKAEEIAWRFFREERLPVTMVYPCWIFGPNDRTFVPLVADAILRKEMVFWRKNVYVWPTYVENLVDLLLKIAIDKRAVGQGYLVHDGEMTTFQEFCAQIAVTLGEKPPKLHIPYFIAYSAAWVLEIVWKLLRKKTRPLLTTYTVKNLGSQLRFSIAKAEKELNWKPRIRYKEGMHRTLEWLTSLDTTTLKEK